MVYLICNRCDDIINFQPGESPDDFDLDCRCGEKLELKDIETHKRFTDDMPLLKVTKKDLRVY